MLSGGVDVLRASFLIQLLAYLRNTDVNQQFMQLSITRLAQIAIFKHTGYNIAIMHFQHHFWYGFTDRKMFSRPLARRVLLPSQGRLSDLNSYVILYLTSELQ